MKSRCISLITLFISLMIIISGCGQGTEDTPALNNIPAVAALYTYILIGEVAITPSQQVEDAFDNAVQEVKDSVAAFSFIPQEDANAVNPWMVVAEIEMPFSVGSFGTLIEICSPMFADDAMAMGQHHASGMPCKIGVWTEDTDEDGTDDVVKINLLNESTTFSFFFADVMSAPGFDDFAGMIKAQGKEILQTAINNLDGEWLYTYQTPSFTSSELAAVQSWADDGPGGYAGENGYATKLEIPFAGNKDVGQSDPNFLSEIKNNIISAIGNDPNARDDWHVIDPNFNMPVADYTSNTFAKIGQIQLCSAYYAGQVVGLGGKYMVALPCTVSVWLNDLTWNQQGMPIYQQPDRVIVSILNPEFILQNYFKDLPLSVLQQMAGMGPEIKNEVQKMVDYGLNEYTY